MQDPLHEHPAGICREDGMKDPFDVSDEPLAVVTAKISSFDMSQMSCDAVTPLPIATGCFFEARICFVEGSPMLKAAAICFDCRRPTPVHLLVLPERHVASVHDIAEFRADEAKRMLEFIAQTARDQGLEDYRVVVNAGAGAGQTIFHLHWHILSGRLTGRMA